MITTKLFIGCQLGPELRIQLNQSLAWKQSRLGSCEANEPVEVQFENRHYLGFFVDQDRARVDARSFPRSHHVPDS